jgi:hypothetical protein
MRRLAARESFHRMPMSIDRPTIPPTIVIVSPTSASLNAVDRNNHDLAADSASSALGLR